jgi:outer membrane protein TolC
MRRQLTSCLLVALTAVPILARAQLRPRSAAAPGSEAGATLQLSLKEAVNIALSPAGNARLQLAEELIQQARARSAQSRAALLPNIDGAVTQQSQTRNLAALGVRIQLPVPGFSFPTFVGPFNVFDARATASQSVFDLSAIRRYQASRAGISLAEAEKENARDQVRDLVARAYLAGLRAQASVEAEKANVELSEALLKLAASNKDAGTGTGIEVTRARVQLANQRQRLLVAQNELRRAHLQLLKALGLDLDAAVVLSDPLTYLPVAPVTPEQALQVALESRPDWKAQQKRQAAAALTAGAAKVERLPSVYVFGDYGSSGSSIDNSVPTRVIGFQVRIPVFDGGRRDARRAENYSLLRQESIRGHDLRAQIELEVRTALDGLQSATDQVQAAQEGLALATNESAQAERRYKAGVGSSIEVTDAQTRLERARNNMIVALFNYNLARIDLGSATGTIRQVIQ